MLIEDNKVAQLYRKHWDELKNASPPKLDPAGFPDVLVAANDKSHSFTIGGAKLDIWFTRTSDGRDMEALRNVITSAQDSILFVPHSG